METKPLLYGLIGFFIGGLLVSVAATTFDKPAPDVTNSTGHSMTMDDMSAALKGKTGDDYDKEFLNGMIAHHEGALVMAQQSADSAKHQELKDLSKSIVSAQEQEIEIMKQWQKDWGYADGTDTQDHPAH